MLTIRAMSDGQGYSARHLEHRDYAFGDFFLMISTSCLEKPPPKTLRLPTFTTAPTTTDHIPPARVR